jgi:neutral ceramidase
MNVRRAIGLWVVMTVLCGSVVLTSEVRAADRVLKAGAYAADITPESFPIDVNGNLRTMVATTASDPLHARCLVLDDGETTVAIVIVDSCAIYRETIDEARELAEKATGIPAAHMLISATHSHSCPAVVSVFQTDAVAPYQKFLSRRIAEGIEQAWKQRVPSKIGFGAGSDPSQLFNRRWYLKETATSTNPFGKFGKVDKVRMNPGLNSPDVTKSTGIIDPAVHVLSLKDADDKPLAVYASYSLHYVGGTPANAVSADYFAVVADRLAQLTGGTGRNPPFMGALSNGTSGDVNNVNFAASSLPTRGPQGQIKVVAESVSQTAIGAWSAISHEAGARVASADAEIELRVRKASAEELAFAKAELAKAGPGPYNAGSLVYARETVALADYPDSLKVRLQVVRAGPVTIYAIPCEVFAEIGLELKEKSPLQPCFTVSMANGYFGYLPTPAQHELGGYETWRARSSFLEEEASTKIVAKLLELANNLKGK